MEWFIKALGELGIYLGITLNRLFDIALKMALSFGVTLAAFSFEVITGKHGIAFTAFIFLIGADWLTKRYAVCRKYVSETKGIPIDDIDVYTALKAWNKARGAGYWQSSKMRKKSNKIIKYIFGVGVAVIVDILTSAIAGKELFTNLMLFYFGITEVESILENLGEAGIKKAEELGEVIDKKKAQYIGISFKKDDK